MNTLSKKHKKHILSIMKFVFLALLIMAVFPRQWEIVTTDGGSYGSETWSYLYNIKFWHPVDRWEKSDPSENNGVIYKIIMGDPHVEIKILDITVFKKTYSVWQ